MTEEEWVNRLADCYEAILKEVGDGLDPPEEETPPAATGGERNSADRRAFKSDDCRVSIIRHDARLGNNQSGPKG